MSAYLTLTDFEVSHLSLYTCLCVSASLDAQTRAELILHSNRRAPCELLHLNPSDPLSSASVLIIDFSECSLLAAVNIFEAVRNTR